MLSYDIFRHYDSPEVKPGESKIKIYIDVYFPKYCFQKLENRHISTHSADFHKYGAVAITVTH